MATAEKLATEKYKKVLLLQTIQKAALDGCEITQGWGG